MNGLGNNIKGMQQNPINRSITDNC